MFRLIPASALNTFALFEEYPVWSEFYDYEEFYEIVEWGIDPDWLQAERDRHDFSNWRLDFQGGFFSHLLFCFALGTGLFDHFIANHRLYHRSQRPTRRFSTRLGRTRRRS